MTIETLKIYLSNPWFYIYILPPFLIVILLPYVRKLYPKEMQDKIKECEISRKDKRSKSIGKKTIFFMFSLIGIWILLCVSYSIFFTDFNQKEIILKCIPSLMFPMGIYVYFEKRIFATTLTKEEYQYYEQKLSQCIESDFKIGQKFHYFIEKYRKIIAIIFMLMALSSFFIDRTNKSSQQECKQKTDIFLNDNNPITPR